MSGRRRWRGRKDRSRDWETPKIALDRGSAGRSLPFPPCSFFVPFSRPLRREHTYTTRARAPAFTPATTDAAAAVRALSFASYSPLSLLDCRHASSDNTSGFVFLRAVRRVTPLLTNRDYCTISAHFSFEPRCRSAMNPIFAADLLRRGFSGRGRGARRALMTNESVPWAVIM